MKKNKNIILIDNNNKKIIQKMQYKSIQMKCYNNYCNNLGSPICNNNKCGKCCNDFKCKRHSKQTKKVAHSKIQIREQIEKVTSPVFIESRILCEQSIHNTCKKYKTRACHYNKCTDCCLSDDCLQHQTNAKKYKECLENEILDEHWVLGEDYIFCSMCENVEVIMGSMAALECFMGDNAYICEICDKAYCDDCNPYGVADIDYVKYYCHDCCADVSDDPFCEKCKRQKNYSECWACDGCVKIFCTECNAPNDSRDEYYCDDCYGNLSDSPQESESESDNESDNEFDNDSEDEMFKDAIKILLEKKDYSNIFDMFGYKIKNLKTKQNGKCAICMENKINCRPECKHGYCVECFIKNTLIFGKNTCACCRGQIGKNIRLYGF